MCERNILKLKKSEIFLLCLGWRKTKLMTHEHLGLLMFPGFDESISGQICLSMSQYLWDLKCAGHTMALHPTYEESSEAKDLSCFLIQCRQKKKKTNSKEKELPAKLHQPSAECIQLPSLDRLDSGTPVKLGWPQRGEVSSQNSQNQRLIECRSCLACI